ncbi:MAG: NADH-quinone oxidoreductase subunit C [Actinobacteria bacterium]|nr:NADH-quinone oxidoreductase subunit C [Actinomycetota bacterium]MBU1493435.1 NADH-quinone oxidoreductase subunit C [Actinomycetota bacterium]
MTEETGVTEETLAGEAPAVLTEDPVLAGLAGEFPNAGFEAARGHDIARVGPAEVAGFVDAARRAGFDYFLDLCAVDHLDRRPQRYEVVVNLVDPRRPVRLLVKVALEGPDPVMPSLTGVFPGANFYEREAFDLMGVRFEGHPDLTRILLPEEWEGHPLRKDAPVGSVPIQFKESEAR